MLLYFPFLNILIISQDVTPFSLTILILNLQDNQYIWLNIRTIRKTEGKTA